MFSNHLTVKLRRKTANLNWGNWQGKRMILDRHLVQMQSRCQDHLVHFVPHFQSQIVCVLLIPEAGKKFNKINKKDREKRSEDTESRINILKDK